MENRTYRIDTTNDFNSAVNDFEEKIKNLHHKRCNVCRSVAIDLDLKRKRDGSGRVMCKVCVKNNYNEQDMQSILPVWSDENGKVCYHLPPKLLGLREGEKLIISPYLVYVPLHHLRKGQLASKGHVCCFPQDIPSFTSTLPRLPKDAQLIKVIRSYQDANDTDMPIKTKDFSIRRDKICAALLWLKKHSMVFKDITIDFDNLSWMEESSEMELPPVSCHEEAMNPTEFDYDTGNNDRGPAPEEQYSNLFSHEHIEQEHTYGS